MLQPLLHKTPLSRTGEGLGVRAYSAVIVPCMPAASWPGMLQ
jgi:hypothetical protein